MIVDEKRLWSRVALCNALRGAWRGIIYSTTRERFADNGERMIFLENPMY